MKSLIPEFIDEAFSAGERQGRFRAFALFIDLTDFTPLTEAMMNQGKEGAEKLSLFLNSMFAPLVRMVYERGGFVPYFAGDAFHGIFPLALHEEEQLESILQLANEIRQFVVDLPPVEKFKVGVKQGLELGEAEWGIVGKDEVHSFYFRGSAIDGSSDAQCEAKEQELVVSESIKRLSPKGVKFKSVKDFFKVTSIPNDILRKEVKKAPRSKGISKKVAKLFLPTSIIETDHPGEFRNVISTFISFEGAKDHEQLDVFVSEILQLFSSYGGYFKEVDFGDKGGVLVGFFGAPVGFEDNDSRALEVLCTVQEKLETNPRLASIRMRGGLTRGTAFTGNIGGDERAQYAVVGNNVNLAARLMMKAEWGEIFVDENLKRNKGFAFAKKGDFKYKGVADLMPTYLLESKKETSSELLFQNPMIGRVKELKSLLTFLKSQIDLKIGSITLLLGEAGIGKSIFLQKAKDHFTREGKMDWYRLQPDPIIARPFHCFIQFLKQFFLQNNAQTKTENRRLFDNSYNSFLSKFESEIGTGEVLDELERTRPIIAALVGVTYENSVWEQLDAKGRFENAIAAITNFIVANGSLNPLFLEIEDAHALDENSQALLQKLVPLIKELPIQILLAARTSDTGEKPKSILPEWAEVLPSLELNLSAFAKSETKQLAESILEGKISEQLSDLLQRTSDGNPFYIEQIVQYFSETNILKKVKKEWTVKETEVGLSDSIQSILVARIDRLSNMVKETVKAAAVIGREFEMPVLTEVLSNDTLLSDLDATVVAEQVKTGERVQIWQAINELRYIFKHSLFRKTVYEMQLRSRLRKLHKLIAEAIEKLYEANLEERYRDLAFHYQEAQVPAKAIEYLKKAAIQARENFQNQRAIELYEQLLAFYKKGDYARDEVVALLKKSSVYELIGDWEACEKNLKSALRKAKKLEEKKLIARVDNELGRLHLLQGEYLKANEHFEKAIANFKSAKDQHGIAKCNGNIGIWHFRKGAYENAKKYLRQSIQLSRELEIIIDPQIVSSLGLAHMNQGNFAEGIHEIKEELNVAVARNDKRSMSNLLTFMGILQMEKEDHEDALESLEQAFELSESLGNKLLISITTGCIGSIYQEKGDFKTAMTNFDKDLKICLELGDKQGIAIAHGLVGELQAIIGEFDKARRHLKKSSKVSKKIGYQKGFAKAENNMGDIYYAQKRFDKAEKKYKKAVAVSRAMNNKLVLGESLLELGQTVLELGKLKKAQSLHDEALAIGEELGNEDFIFGLKILQNRIEAVKGNQAAAIAGLYEMKKEYMAPEEIANVLYQLALLEPNEASHKEKVIAIYRELFSKTPRFIYKNRIKELGG